MAPPGVKNRSSTGKKATSITSRAFRFIQPYFTVNYVKSLIFDPAQLPIVSVGILLLEFVLNIVVVHRVKYTEIDWVAYMQECEGFLNGTTNYALLRGDTGPLVYPAGFVYIYSILYYITNRGTNIRLAQYIFIAIYLLQMFLVLKIYAKSRKVPPYVLVITAFTSYRIHSIYVLRLFNDPIAILFAYAAINLYLSGHWTIGSVFLSLGVSVKMNILLFAPAILLFYIVNLGYLETIKQLLVCGVVQLVLGAPFLFTYPIEYIRGSFDLGRVFEHKWTVNYRFLPREVFEQKYFHVTLLAIHVILLIVFVVPAYQYFQSYCRLRALQTQLQPQIDAKNQELASKKKSTKSKSKNDADDANDALSVNQKIFLNSFEAMLRKSCGATRATESNSLTSSPPAEESSGEPQKFEIFFDKAVQLAILPIFLANFIGVMCARSLHYQFYVWYFHSLPYLVWSTEYNLNLKLALLGVIELVWNVYPSTDLSSSVLHLSHLAILFGVGYKLLRSHTDSQRLKAN